MGSPISPPRSIAKTTPCRKQHKSSHHPSSLRISRPLCLRLWYRRQIAPHQSPIWIKAGPFPGIPALGTSVPHTIFGAKPCPIMSSQNLWLSLGCPDPIQLTVWAKRKQRWSAEISNQTLWLCQTPYWLISAAQTYPGNISLAS